MNFSYAVETCKYKDKIEECLKSDNKLAIEEFICIKLDITKYTIHKEKK